MSDTPRTDAFYRKHPIDEYEQDHESLLEHAPPWLTFARQLERELAEERRGRIDRIEQALDALCERSMRLLALWNRACSHGAGVEEIKHTKQQLHTAIVEGRRALRTIDHPKIRAAMKEGKQ